MNELVKSQVKIMTDDGKYCSFKSMYGVAVGAMISSDFVTEKHYFSALSKLNIIERRGTIWTAPEHIRDEMITNDIEVMGIYRRKTTLKDDSKYLHSFGFNCGDEDEFIKNVLSPVIKELDTLELMLIEADKQNEEMKSVLKAAGLPISSLNPRNTLEREVMKWEKS